jgi:hypothetical protein
LEGQIDGCSWSDTELDIQMPKPKLRTKIFWFVSGLVGAF